MGWSIIQQPNKLFARFSENVDNITDYDMSTSEVIDLCQQEYGLSSDDAERKLQRAIESPDRWQNALDSIRAVHGDSEADTLEKDCSQQKDQ